MLSFRSPALAARLEPPLQPVRRAGGGHRPIRASAVIGNALRRVRPTLQQVGLSRADRALNVQGAFKVPREQIFRRAAGSCWLTMFDLRRQSMPAHARCCGPGAASVDVLVFARVVDTLQTPI
jgi:hypothetical protein